MSAKRTANGTAGESNIADVIGSVPRMTRASIVRQRKTVAAARYYVDSSSLLSLPPRATIMLSRQLLRPLSGTRRLAQTHGARAFSATTKKRAEVELTIGEYLRSRSDIVANLVYRWQEGLYRRYFTATPDVCPPLTHFQLDPPSFKHAKRPALSFPDTVTTKSS